MTVKLEKKVISFLVCILFLTVLMGCKKQLPQAYQEESFTISSALDLLACYYLSRDLFVTDTVVVDTDTSIVTYPVHEPISTVYLPDSVVSNWFDSLMVSGAFDTLLTDTTLLINYPEGEDTSYAFYYQDGGSNTAYFYVSWDLTAENIDAYVNIGIIQRDGKRVPKKSSTIPLETVAGCTELVELQSGGQIRVPKIRAREVYGLAETPYLVRFIVSEPSEVESFRVVILHD